MTMKILLPADGTAPSPRGTRFALRWARKFGVQGASGQFRAGVQSQTRW